MSLLANHFDLIATGILAYLAGAALVYLRFECPAFGWTRRDGSPLHFWATHVQGTDVVLHCSRTSALEDAIQRLVDKIEVRRDAVCTPKNMRLRASKQE